jgi:hypothetical protein
MALNDSRKNKGYSYCSSLIIICSQTMLLIIYWTIDRHVWYITKNIIFYKWSVTQAFLNDNLHQNKLFNFSRGVAVVECSLSSTLASVWPPATTRMSDAWGHGPRTSRCHLQCQCPWEEGVEVVQGVAVELEAECLICSNRTDHSVALSNSSSRWEF